MTDCRHVWAEEHYGYVCVACGLVDPCFDYDWTEYPDDGDEWEEEEDSFDCGWMRGMGCSMAGSEECDFECPYRRDYEKGMALTRARLAKRAKEKQ